MEINKVLFLLMGGESGKCGYTTLKKGMKNRFLHNV
ncbi:hypothetical protein HBHAL_2503 [Halobacillus halophilus DSM 2266]|uniref:Uncharacterized protein n=1 Tax=Halobacillus halophilus (strain ATCC 35676 / DSM 2266 / JCM 20832 / KCTC 3685 / LMG 17431 / NBRC 102448 / NCIMB 2269) TaxID=866895 RepID=I0JL27_HALH3|nr:hypothetical protein HBHAL_2503 [Halobacillus halophilus DSM 2266]